MIRSRNLWISASKQNLDRTVHFGSENVGSNVPISNTKWKVNNTRKSNAGLECRHFLKLEIYFCPSANKDNPWRIQGFPGGSEVKESACNVGELGSIPGSGRKWHPTPVVLPGESHGWRSLVGHSPRGRRQSDTTEGLHFDQYMFAFWTPEQDLKNWESEHKIGFLTSGILLEGVGFPSGSDRKEPAFQWRRPGFDPWVGKIFWRRKWQPVPAFSGKCHGQRSLACCSLWGHRESDTTERPNHNP